MKRLIQISVILAVLLFLLFLWQEKFSLREKINAEKVSAFATAIAAIFTAVTVFLLYKQNQHMVNERKAAIQPDLYPAELNLFSFSQQVEFANKRFETEAFFLKIGNENKYSLTEEEKNQTSQYFTSSLHNIGLGVAKAINYNWDYDAKGVSELLKLPYKGLFATSTTTPNTIDFIAINSSVEIEFPSNYARCLAPELNKMNTNSEISVKPNLNLNVFYKDVYSNPYKKTFRAEIFCVHNYVNIKFKTIDENKINLIIKTKKIKKKFI